MSIIENLNRNLPASLNKTDEVHEAVWGKENFTPEIIITESSDFNCGAISNEFEFLNLFIEYIIGCYNPNIAESDMLDELVEFFTGLNRMNSEFDMSLRKRFFSLVYRNGSKKWMPKWSVLKVFSYFFSISDMFIQENYVESTLLLNGDFEDVVGGEPNHWNIVEGGSSTVQLNMVDEFIGSDCIEFNVNSSSELSSLDQTINSVVEGNFQLSFFYEDDGDFPLQTCLGRVVVQRSSNSNYYNFSTNSWQVGISYYDIPRKSSYDIIQLLIKNEGTTNINVKFVNYQTISSHFGPYKFRLDYAEFGEWKTYPSIRLIVRIGYVPDLMMCFWDSGEDPIVGYNYAYASFLDNDGISGLSTIYEVGFYQDILHRIKTGGVKENLLIVQK